MVNIPPHYLEFVVEVNYDSIGGDRAATILEFIVEVYDGDADHHGASAHRCCEFQ